MFQSTSVIGLVWLASWDLHHNSASIDDAFSHSLVLHWCYADLRAVLGSSALMKKTVKRSVASHEAVIDNLGCAGY